MENKIKTPIRDILCVFAVQVFYCKAIFSALYVVAGLEQLDTEPSLYLFFASCILAPVWEEFIYRHVPLQIAKNYFKKNLVEIAIGCAVVFGLHHGCSLNILIQGVFGIMFTWVYIRNGLKWAICSHALWNFYCFIQ